MAFSFHCWCWDNNLPNKWPQLLLASLVLEAFHHLGRPPLDTLWWCGVLLILRPSKLHIVLQVESHQCSEWDSCLSRLASDAVLDAPQDMVGPFGCQGTLWQGTVLTCWHTVGLGCQPKPPDLFLWVCSPASCSTVCTYNQDYPTPRWRILHLLLLNFVQLVIAPLFSLSRSLCKASLPWRESTAPPNLV